MKKSDAAFITAAVFSAAFTIAYAVIMYFKIKVPRYFPVEHAWAYSTQPGKIAQGWYGMFALAFVAALIISLIAFCILRSDKFKSNPAILKTVSVTSLLIISFLMVWFVLHELIK
jgi:hypothetical protein